MQFFIIFFTFIFLFNSFFIQKASANTIGWQQVIQNGAVGSPPLRASNTNSAWDSNQNRWLVFGGYDATNISYFNDLWEYSTANGWKLLTPQNDPAAPPIRTNHSVSWDSQHNRLLVFGGYCNENFCNDLWEYTNTSGWHLLTPNGAATSPTPRDDMTMVWDTQNSRLLLFGGVSYISSPHEIYNDLWQYTDAGGWKQLIANGDAFSPTARNSQGGTWDSQNNRMLIFGGSTNVPFDAPFTYTNDLW